MFRDDLMVNFVYMTVGNSFSKEKTYAAFVGGYAGGFVKPSLCLPPEKMRLSEASKLSG